MDAARYQQVKAILMDALDLAPTDRDQLLRDRCGDDVDLRAEIESLLHHAGDDEFLEPAAFGGKNEPSAAACLRFIKGPPSLIGRVFPLAPRVNSVGRTEECDVRLEAPSISRRHATIAPTADGEWTVEDAGSSNGIRARGERVQTARLKYGDHVGFGREIVAVLEAAEDDSAHAIP